MNTYEIKAIGENEYQYRGYTISGNDNTSYVCIAPYGSFSPTSYSSLAEATAAIDEDCDYIESQKHSTLTTSQVYSLCNQFKWFTCGSNISYTKMFELVENNATIHDIAVAIWVCSDPTISLDDIENTIAYIEAGSSYVILNRSFERFCDALDDAVCNIKVRATKAETEKLNGWLSWLHTKGQAVSEWTIIKCIDRILPELAERCGKEMDSVNS